MSSYESSEEFLKRRGLLHDNKSTITEINLNQAFHYLPTVICKMIISHNATMYYLYSDEQIECMYINPDYDVVVVSADREIIIVSHNSIIFQEFLKTRKTENCECQKLLKNISERDKVLFGFYNEKLTITQQRIAEVFVNKLIANHPELVEKVLQKFKENDDKEEIVTTNADECKKAITETIPNTLKRIEELLIQQNKLKTPIKDVRDWDIRM